MYYLPICSFSDLTPGLKLLLISVLGVIIIGGIISKKGGKGGKGLDL